VGEAAATSHHRIQAAKQYSRDRPDDRADFYVDNVNVQHSDGDVRELAVSTGVRVLSCFEVQPRRRRSDTTPPARNAFRLCILDKDRSALASGQPMSLFQNGISKETQEETDTISVCMGSVAAAAATAAVSTTPVARSEGSDNQTMSGVDCAAGDDDVQTARGLSACNLPAVSAAVDVLVDQELLSVGDSVVIGSAVNEMECNDDTIISIVDKSAILTTSVCDGSEC